MFKKGDIWVSAILYIVLSLIVITLLLNAGIPLINKMKDRNTLTQTKELINTLDKKIRFVADQGPGAQEPFYIEIKSGEFTLDEKANRIIWTMKTSDKSQEPNIILTEGNIQTLLNKTIVKDEYIISVYVDYTNRLNLTVKSDYGNTLKGSHQLSISHVGITDKYPIISIEVK